MISKALVLADHSWIVDSCFDTTDAKSGGEAIPVERRLVAHADRELVKYVVTGPGFGG